MNKIGDKKIRKGVFLKLHYVLEKINLEEAIQQGGSREEISKRKKSIKMFANGLEAYSPEEIESIDLEIQRMFNERKTK